MTKIAGCVDRRPPRTLLVISVDHRHCTAAKHLALISLSPCSPRRRGLRSGSLRHGQRRLDTPGWALMRRRKAPPVLLPSRKRQKMGWRLVWGHLQDTREWKRFIWCCPDWNTTLPDNKTACSQWESEIFQEENQNDKKPNYNNMCLICQPLTDLPGVARVNKRGQELLKSCFLQYHENSD